MLLAVVAIAAAVLARSGRGTGSAVLPTIGGDTWPPVPVKDARRV